MNYRSLRHALISMIILVNVMSGVGSCLSGVEHRSDATSRIDALSNDVAVSLQAKQYKKAADGCREMIRLQPENGAHYYNLACAVSLMGKKDEAITAIEQAIDHGQRYVEQFRNDDDLIAIRQDARFVQLLDKLDKSFDPERAEPFEHGKEMEEFTTVEALPGGGLRYRLRLSSKATSEKPHRLIVWMHPSGGSMNEQIEEYLPRLADHGFALMVLTKKDFTSWTGRDQSDLMNGTLPALKNTPGLDIRKPVLMGHSAGGQAALMLWQEVPEQFGGLIVSAAYPLDIEKANKGKVELMATPKSPAVKTVPIFAVVGLADDGSQVWKAVETPWKKALIPLTVTYVPKGKHEWLLDKTITASLLNWLDKAVPRTTSAKKP